jgi:N6-adenosine-specific RNA methylase IME4
VSLSLALPEASQIGLSEVRARLIPLCRLLREEIRDQGDIDSARELTRRLDAFRHYLTDKEARDLVAAEQRRTEVLVGYLLGAVVERQRTDLDLSHARDSLLQKDDRSRFRLLAANEALVEELLAEGYVTRRVLLDKIQGTKIPRQANTSAPTELFTTICADPPWQYDNRATRAAAVNHYETLTPKQVAEYETDGRPVSGWKAAEAHLYLWTTNAFLRQAFDVLEAWGFTYKTTLVWVKPQLGIGNYFRSSHEFILFGTSGDLPVKDRNQRSWFEARRGRHSAKPEYFYELVERVSPGPYLELFGRPSPLFGPREGWTVRGREA